jgi:hypothetical protein
LVNAYAFEVALKIKVYAENVALVDLTFEGRLRLRNAHFLSEWHCFLPICLYLLYRFNLLKLENLVLHSGETNQLDI